MSDLLVDNDQLRGLIKTLGLPLPVPAKLKRAKGPYEDRPLDNKAIVVGGNGALSEVLAKTLIHAGAEITLVAEDEAALEPYEAPGEAWARPVELVAPGAAPEEKRIDALVFDATELENVADLRQLYDVLHPWVRQLRANGRAVVIGRPHYDQEDPELAAVCMGLEGFTRALAKEIGRNGGTANSIFIEEGAEERAEGVLRFFLSARSAFISCQPLYITNEAKSGKIPYTQPLTDKIALVTGAARGIGKATAELLAAEGAHVVCLDRPADDGPTSQVARDIGGSVLLVDVTDPEAPEKIASDLQERFGGVDIVVHNAGVTRDKTLRNMKPEQWDLAVDINLGAVVRITDHLLESKVIKNGGRIVCLSSVSGIAGNRGQTNYSASKAGLVGYVRALAPEVAKRGITINAIAPGFIETRLTAAMPVPIREAARRLSALGQGGRPVDVGQAITFLATPGAVGVTGNTLRVCGGALIGA